MINELKAVLLIIFSALGSFFMPITDYMLAILMLLGVNFLSGWIEDELHGKGWKWKKAFKTFYECFVMVAIGACLFVIGHYMHKDYSAIQCLSVIYFAAIWFYSVNILNNWKKILPPDTTLHRFVLFLHFVVSLQFVEKVPYLKAFLMQEAKEKENKQTGKKDEETH